MPIRSFLFVGLVLGILSGCATNEVHVKTLSEKEIAEHELILQEARLHFFQGNYEGAIDLVKPLTHELTANLPLYQSELGIYYLASDNKEKARQYLFDAYVSIEDFFDPRTERRAVSIWGAETEKVFKGEPYEQATLSFLLGLLLLEEGDIDNALACFKNGQIADSDVMAEQYNSDYGILQLMEAKCYGLRGERDRFKEFNEIAIGSFSKTHPAFLNRHSDLLIGGNISETEIARSSVEKAILKEKDSIAYQYRNYYGPLLEPYNNLLLVWTGRSPTLERAGRYGEERIIVMNPQDEIHFEVKLNQNEWHDTINGFSNIAFQATTRGGRLMDDVLASQADFKRTTEQIGSTMFDMANSTSDPYATVAFLAVGLISGGLSSSANVSADIRCVQSLPSNIGIVPLNLSAGSHTVTLHCYDRNLMLTRKLTQTIHVQPKPFQFHIIYVPSLNCEKKSINEIASQGQIPH